MSRWTFKYAFGMKILFRQKRYFDSQFLLRPNADNLLESLTTAIKDLSQEKLIQLSMDGPSTNWSVLDKLSL